VALANAVFRPAEADIAHALRVVAAAAQAARDGLAAFTVDGRMMDGPFVRRAESLLCQARAHKLLEPDATPVGPP
jgi:citrate lyase subunit beta/citryl-CoA lyase